VRPHHLRPRRHSPPPGRGGGPQRRLPSRRAGPVRPRRVVGDAPRRRPHPGGSAMSLVTGPPEPGSDSTTATAGASVTADRLRRAWATPLRTHFLALAIVLVVAAAIVGTTSSFSADEGAAITQARSLAHGDGWIVEHPVPEIDPTGDLYPLELSARGPRGVAPFAKPP